MTDSASHVGMLYLVHIRAVRAATKEIVTAAYLLVADSLADVQRRIAYVVDLSEFSYLTVQHVEKIRLKAHVLWMRVRDDSDVAPPSGNRAAFQPLPGGNLADMAVFSVAISGCVVAKDEAHAVRRLGSHLVRRGETGYTGNPLSSDGEIKVERIPTLEPELREKARAA